MNIMRSAERGVANHGWLRSFHTFSFADYHNPQRMGFRTLRVLNDDRVAPGKGFGTHSHQNMEIVSYVLFGALQHKDSMGTGSIIRPGDVQRMTAGTGVAHSEFNASATDEVHFLQIWILPEQRGLPPGYEQKTFSDAEKRGRLRLIASRDGRDGSVTVHQDVALFAGTFAEGERARHEIGAGRSAWLHVARGAVDVAGARLEAGDAASFDGPCVVEVAGVKGGEVLLFDLL